VFSSVVGGIGNCTTGACSFIGGGECNTVKGLYSSILGGQQNIAASIYTSIFGGQGNVACHPYSSVQGCNITSRMECAFHANRIVVTALPSSAVGLPIGAMWYDPADGNRVKYVSA
jgi:hypothetical protein